MVAKAFWIPGIARGALLVGLLGSASLPAQDGPALLEALRAQGPDRLVRSTNYACQMDLRRTQKKVSQGIQIEENARLEVAHAEGREVFSWPGEPSFRSDELRDILVAGLSGSGSFAGHLRAVVFSNRTQFGEPKTLPERPGVVVLPYQMPAEGSGYVVNVDGREREVAIAGEVTLTTSPGGPRLAAFSLRAVGLPPDFPAQSVAEAITFVGGIPFGQAAQEPTGAPRHNVEGVPWMARQSMAERNGDEYENTIVFSRCREYRGESSLRFDNGDGARSAQDSPPRQPPVSTRPVPPGVPVDAVLSAGLEWGKQQTGDEIEAVVTRDARFKGSTVVPEGARLRGRIVELKKVTGKSEGYLVGLVFHEAVAGNRTIPLHMVLEALPGMPKGARRGIAAIVHGENARFRTMERTSISGSPMRVGGFFQALGPQLDVPKGLEMRWVTVESEP
jgi:hypothetical protein